MVTQFIDDREKDVAATKGVVAGVQRKPFDYSKVETRYLKGTNLDSPDGSAVVEVPSKAGDNKSDGGGVIELIHFGTVFADSQRKFTHEDLEDYQTIDMASELGGRAIAHRAALERELLLLCGYMLAIKAAMAEAGKAPPNPDEPDGLQMLNSALGFLGDMLGGDAAAQAQASTLDLNPLIDQAKQIIAKLDVAEIKYEDVHDAGIKLHELRCKYQSFLQSQHALLPEGAGPAAGGLGGLPFVGDLLKNLGPVGEILSWAQKISNLALGLLPRLTLELHMKMEASIDKAARECSANAIRNRFTPIYSVWFIPPPVPEEPEGGDDEGGATDPLGKALESAKKEVEGAIAPVTSKLDEITDLLTLPVETTPGTPYLEQAFLLKKDASVIDRSEALAMFAGEALLRALNEEWMPPIIGEISGHIFKLVTEFVRAVYGKLLILGNEAVTEDALLMAGKAHLVDAIIELPFTYLTFLEDVRTFGFDVALPGKTVRLSPEVLIFHIKRLITEQLAFMDPAVAFAMKDFHKLLTDARTMAGDNALTMEAYLALVPSLHARMFRNLLLPFWTAMMNAVKGGLAQALGPVLGAIGGPFGGDGAFNKAYGVMDKAQQGIARAGEVIDQIGKGFAISPTDDKSIKEWENLGRDFTDPANPWGSPTASSLDVVFPARKTKGKGKAITKDTLDTVAATHKWEEALDEAAAAPPTNGAAADGAAKETAS
jgi:hypothetical protein